MRWEKHDLSLKILHQAGFETAWQAVPLAKLRALAIAPRPSLVCHFLYQLCSALWLQRSQRAEQSWYKTTIPTGRPRWFPIRSGCGSALSGTGFESRPRSDVCHRGCAYTVCTNMFKCMGCALCSAVYGSRTVYYKKKNRAYTQLRASFCRDIVMLLQ